MPLFLKDLGIRSLDYGVYCILLLFVLGVLTTTIKEVLQSFFSFRGVAEVAKERMLLDVRKEAAENENKALAEQLKIKTEALLEEALIKQGKHAKLHKESFN